MTPDAEHPDLVTDHPSRLNVRRISGWAAMLGALLIVVAGVQILRERQKAELEEDWVLTRFGLGSPVANRLAEGYRDADQDLIADPPPAEECVRPERLTFSFIAEDQSADPGADWKNFTDRLADATGLPVDYLPCATVTEQLAAMRDGRLHVTAFNTGNVPRAVNACGFVPVSAKANSDGEWRITMKLIVPEDSPVKRVADLRQHDITFTNPGSFSGFRLAIVRLQKEFQMLPGTDYDYRFSTSHNQSIQNVAKGDLEAACVASDMLADAAAAGQIDPQSVRAVYESTAFPAAAFGYAYNLEPTLAAKVKDFLEGGSLVETPLDPAGEGSPANTLVATNYKSDWNAVREVDDATGWKHELPENLESPVELEAEETTAETAMRKP